MPTCVSERVQKKGFPEECRRQSLLLAKDSHEAEVLDWIEEVSDREGWTS